MNDQTQEFQTLNFENIVLENGKVFELVPKLNFLLTEASICDLKICDKQPVTVKLQLQNKNQETVLCTLTKKKGDVKLEHLVKKDEKIKLFTTGGNASILLKGLQLCEEDSINMDDSKDKSQNKESALQLLMEGLTALEKEIELMKWVSSSDDEYSDDDSETIGENGLLKNFIMYKTQEFPRTIVLEHGKVFEVVPKLNFLLIEATICGMKKCDKQPVTVKLQLQDKNQEIILCTLSREKVIAKLEHLVKKDERIKLFTTGGYASISLTGLKLSEEDLINIDDFKDRSKIQKMFFEDLKKSLITPENEMESVNSSPDQGLQLCEEDSINMDDSKDKSQNKERALQSLDENLAALKKEMESMDWVSSSDESSDDESKIEEKFEQEWIKALSATVNEMQSVNWNPSPNPSSNSFN